MKTTKAVFSVIAGQVEFPEALDMVLYTSKTDKHEQWSRRGIIDSIYIDERSRLVSIGVDQRDIIDVDLDQEILLMAK